MKKVYFAICIVLLLIDVSSVAAQENWDELNKKSMTAYTAKDYDGAFAYTQQALTQAEKEYGIESPRYALSASNLAYMFNLRKEFKEAEKYYIKAIDIRKKLNLEADYAISVSQYAIMLHKDLRDLPNAEKYLLAARDINKKLYTEQSTQYYSIASELATLYFNAKRYDEAEPYYLYKQQSIKTRKGVNSEDYVYILKDLIGLYDKYADKAKYAVVYEEMLDILAALGYDNNQNYFNGMFILGGYYEQQKNIDKAITIYQKLLPAIKKTLGDTSTLALVPLVKLVGIYSARADYRNLSIVSVELLAILKDKPGDRSAYLASLEGVSAIFQMTGDYTRAEEAQISLADALKKEKGANSAEYLLVLRQLGDIQLNLGKHKNAEQTYREAMNNRGQKDMEYAADLTKMAYVIGITGRLGEAEKKYMEAMQIFKATQKEQTNEYAVLLNYLGNLYASTGRIDDGEALLLRSKEIYAATVGTRHQNYAIALSNLANIYMTKGNYNTAEQLLLEHLDIKAAVFGKEHPEYAFALIRLAMFYKNMGNNAKWEQYLLNALDIQKKVLPPEHPSLMTTLNNLAVFYNNTLQFSKAEPYYLQSLEISRKNLGERLDYLNTLTNLGGLYVNLKNFDKATEIYDKALMLAKKLYGEGLEYANVLQGLALLYDYKGDYQKAEPYFIQSFDIRKKNLQEANPAYVQMNMNMGRLYQAMHNYAKAEPYYAKASELMLGNIDKNFAFLSESEKQDFLNTLDYRFEQLQNFYLNYQKQKSTAANQAFDIELATKGLTLNSAIELRKAIAQSNNPEALKIYDEWMQIRGEIAKRNTAATNTTGLDTLETRATVLEKQITRLSGMFNEGRVLSRARYNDVKQQLGDNDVAIEFASFRRSDDVNWTDSVVYVAIVLRKKDANATMIRLCEARQLDALIQKKGQGDDSFVSSLYRGIKGVEMENNSLANGKKLYDLIWKPIDNLLKPGDKIYFAPAGLLHQIAFAAIPYADGKLLSDQYKLSQVSSTAMLLKDTVKTYAKSIAVFGGIKYDLSAAEKENVAKTTDIKAAKSSIIATDGNRGSSWNYLPGTLTEAENIAKLATNASYATKTYFGADGLEEHIKEMSGQAAPGIIHIASHGFFFPDPESNYAQAAVSENAFSKSANAMNRSGMLFAGANDTWKGHAPATGEDGILTAYEASNLSLTNTSLVVLSACETGLGDIKGNEGVYGLQRSFKMAGATYLMMSLWKVPDAETSEFMQKFYSGLFGGNSIETSFTAAQDAMKKKYAKDPYKWAAFVLVR